MLIHNLFFLLLFVLDIKILDDYKRVYKKSYGKVLKSFNINLHKAICNKKVAKQTFVIILLTNLVLYTQTNVHLKYNFINNYAIIF